MMNAKRQHLVLFPTLIEFRSNEWQLFPKRLTELLARSSAAAAVPSKPGLGLAPQPLTKEEHEEKRALLCSAFPTWTRQDFFLFLYYCDQGRNSLAKVAELLAPHGKTLEQVVQYSQALLSRGPEVFGHETWSKVKLFLNSMYQDEMFEWEWKIKRKLVELEHKSDWECKHHLLGNDLVLDEDCFFLSAFLDRKSAQQVKLDIAHHAKFKLDHFVRSQTVQDLEKKVEALIEATVHGDQPALIAKEEEEDWQDEEKEDEELEANLREELHWLESTLHPSRTTAWTQAAGGGGRYSSAAALRFSPSQSSSPQPKDDDGDSDGGGGSGAGLQSNVISLDPRHHAQVLSVVLSLGTAGMSMLVNQVMKVLPEGSISKRQLKRDILCLAVKEKRAGDRAARWYARNDM